MTMQRWQLHCLQSVMNSAARLISGLPQSARTSTLFARLHWLRAAERFQFESVTLKFRCLYGSAFTYLSASIHRVADVPSHRRLRLASTEALIIRLTRLVPVGNHLFPVTATKL